MTTHAKYVPESEAPSIRGWEIDFGSLAPTITSVVDEALKATFSDPEWEPWVWLPSGVEDGDGLPPMPDPLMLCIALPMFSGRSDNGPVFAVSLGEVIQAEIDIYDGSGIDAESIPRIRALRDALQAQIAIIDAALSVSAD